MKRWLISLLKERRELIGWTSDVIHSSCWLNIFLWGGGALNQPLAKGTLTKLHHWNQGVWAEVKFSFLGWFTCMDRVSDGDVPSSIASPICQGAKWKNLPNFSFFFLIFSLFFLIFSLFFPIFGKYFAVKGGTLLPLDSPVATPLDVPLRSWKVLYFWNRNHESCNFL